MALKIIVDFADPALPPQAPTRYAPLPVPWSSCVTLTCRVDEDDGAVAKTNTKRQVILSESLTAKGMRYGYREGLTLTMLSNDITNEVVATFGAFVRIPTITRKLVVWAQYDWLGIDPRGIGAGRPYLGQFGLWATAARLAGYRPRPWLPTVRDRIDPKDPAVVSGQQISCYTMGSPKVPSTRLNKPNLFVSDDKGGKFKFDYIPFNTTESPLFGHAGAPEPPPSSVASAPFILSLSIEKSAAADAPAPVDLSLIQSSWTFPRGDVVFNSTMFTNSLAELKFAGAVIQITDNGGPQFAPGPIGARIKEMNIFCDW
jgi:hypothetical protein